ncbi:putative glycolipid-binding domain-containing protein [Celeribacter ethanolicus]|uniref:Uncharacterized protein n=1 Tax=Celeribacter ethanolicus TaxID=1758178 RepID=A0A291G9G9_9RHOB|nr:putative glycolipid-binding domain-containing protein [Celeribacter ethanolicus]ATG47193.1 hypothetical protein CEW89_06185 [Celeribacter ethanolicus]TNE64959.1 MAG: hypothetical protein EP336_14240 [Paracoccaceae bacterium]
MSVRIAVRWNAWEAEGMEHCHLLVDAQGAVLTAALSGGQSPAYAAQYMVAADAAFHTREVWVRYVGGPELHVTSDGEGHWRDTTRDEALPALAGCLDVDIAVTPATNMLPIRRLGLAEGESREIEVAYVPPPGEGVGRFLPRKVAQRYTCLGPERYLYEGLSSGFAAEIEVDEHGLVRDYPGVFRRA